MFPNRPSVAGVFLIALVFLTTPCMAELINSPGQTKLVKLLRKVDKQIEKKIKRKAKRKRKKLVKNVKGRVLSDPVEVSVNRLKIPCSQSGKAVISGSIIGSYDKPVLIVQKDIDVNFKNCNGVSGQGRITGDTVQQPGSIDAENVINYEQNVTCSRLNGEKVPGELSAAVTFVTQNNSVSGKKETLGTGALDLSCEFLTGQFTTVLACDWIDVDVKDGEAIEDGCSLFPFL